MPAVVCATAGNTTMPIALFRSLWGLSEPWEEAFPKLKASGFAGVEASLLDVGFPNVDRFVSLLREHNLKWICGLYTSWADYQGKWERLPVATHLSNFASQIASVQSISEPPVHINCHSGSDAFTLAQSLDFFRACKGIQDAARLDIPLSHETHRGRSLYSPWIAMEIAAAVPEIQFTLDVSHWVVVAERHLEPEDIDLVLRRTAHMHARVGTPQAPQIDDPRDPENEVHVKAHERLWRAVVAYQSQNGRLTTTVTPEYGPIDELYMPRNVLKVEGSVTTRTTARQLDELIFDEGERLKTSLLSQPA
ncbi:hypothetical protein BC831DRAFT_461729 [Entophlyctis helioformis]|nr:hypothetical protein BC831DRAFT_461729 [Entophlyctis helioformis]